MTNTQKYTLAGISTIGIILYHNLKKYLKSFIVKTSDYLRKENATTFFLKIAIDRPRRKPLAKYKIDKIYLIVNNKAIAVSTKISEDFHKYSFLQEFTPVNIENLQKVKMDLAEYYGNARVEIVYKTYGIFPIICQYNIECKPNNNTLTIEDNNKPNDSFGREPVKQCSCSQVK